MGKHPNRLGYGSKERYSGVSICVRVAIYLPYGKKVLNPEG